MPRPAIPELAMVLALAAALSPAAWAEKADRSKPMVIEADRSAIVDTLRQSIVYSGNAAISQGSLLLRAERIEMRETADGYRTAGASGLPGKPVTWSQRRDGVGETVEGSAERVEFDGRTDTLRLVGDSVLRMRRNGTITYEVTGGVIVWDNTSEVFKVEGGTVTPANPTGRVRAILTSPGEAASAPRTTPSAPLTPSRALGDKR
ncbi:MAG: lipopolysaccharide transport periplasmic protein LptA [Rubrivivax sp.]|nr:lipopolysaccharide transport periplasmic protein LptA [Rubrivivax sp.]